MDAEGLRTNWSKHPMTIAEMTAQKDSVLNELRKRIEAILNEHQKPLSLAEIQYHLQTERIGRGESPASDDTFDVREAVADLVRTRRAEETVGRSVRLIAG